GRIDDQFGVGFKRPAAMRHDLVEALEEVLAGKAVSVKETPVAGCLIARALTPKPAGKATYAKQGPRILQRRCQECHRPGEIGPMPLLSHEDAVAWSGMIREVVDEKRMPPWNADPAYGHWSNDRSLPAEEKAQLLAWIADGCPRGNDADLPASKDF